MCVWSDWFRGRLTAISPFYTAANTRVTGRLRYPRDDAARPPEPSLAVRVDDVAEAAEQWRTAGADVGELSRGAHQVQVVDPVPGRRRRPGRVAEDERRAELRRAGLDEDVVAGRAELGISGLGRDLRS